MRVCVCVCLTGVKRLLFIGVGCQVQAVRSIEPYLGLDKLYVLGTNCVDNGRRATLDKFLAAASTRPKDVLHYEFMQDYKVCTHTQTYTHPCTRPKDMWPSLAV